MLGGNLGSLLYRDVSVMVKTSACYFCDLIRNISLTLPIMHLGDTRENLSRDVRKPDICICENKDADQLRGNATRIVQFLYFLNPKFPASSYLLWLYSLVCVRPGRKPECCHDAGSSKDTPSWSVTEICTRYHLSCTDSGLFLV